MPQGYNREFDKKSETNSYLSFQDCIGDNPFTKSQFETSSQKPTPIDNGQPHLVERRSSNELQAAATASANNDVMYLNADLSKDGIRSQNNFELQHGPARDDLRSLCSAQAHSETHVTQYLNHIFQNQSFDIDSSHMQGVFNDSNFGTGGQHNNSNYIMDGEEQMIYRRHMAGGGNLGQFSRPQSQMVVGFASLPINPDLIQYNENAYKQLISNELQGSKNAGVEAGMVNASDQSGDAEQKLPSSLPRKQSKKRVRFVEDHQRWNSSRVKYHLNYPYDEFMADNKKREEVDRRETMKKSLSDKLQKKF